MNETAPELVEATVEAARDAAAPWARTPRSERARALRLVADRLDAAAGTLVPLAIRETHLTEPRLRGEVTRTTFQLRLLADHIVTGVHLAAMIDAADPDWPMGPRPDLRRTRVPVGPVVVFAASNFPFAFSVAGGDTASALAAGCPVVVKAHPGHPELSEATAAVVTRSLADAGAPEGVFAMIQGMDAGIAALRHPAIQAGAFTGSIAGGRALFDIATARPVPIPFYGELGSSNPVFVTAAADSARGADVAKGLIASFTMGAGQFCTKPGVVLVPRGGALVTALRGEELPPPAPLLNEAIETAFADGQARLHKHPDVSVLAGTDPADMIPTSPPAPSVHLTGVSAVLADQALTEECFGPTVLVVEYDREEQMLDVARSLPGQLTATVVGEESDAGPGLLGELVPVLTERAGRLLWNQWPTGVSVTYAQQHGGPYPATTAPGTTSVGTAAIDRFTRPVAFQGFPTALLPEELR